MTRSLEATWHVLDVSSVPAAEFASALQTLVPTLGWNRHMSRFARRHTSVRFETWVDPPLDVAHFAVQRGFSNRLLRWSFNFAGTLTNRLLSWTNNPASSPLICTSPFYASVAELWPGPVVYYSTDLTFAYDHLDPRQVLALDRRLCAVAALISPNSARIRDYFMERANAHVKKIVCLPNAARTTSVLKRFPESPFELPADVADLSRPVAGVIGNLAANLDWVVLHDLVQRATWLSWVFVGPTSMTISDREQRQARDKVMRSGPRVRFLGPKPYSSLTDYARSFDVAILPYRKREPTFSGSPTRFYEHLAACRPMLATKGVEQLLQKEPLVHLADDADGMLAALQQLKAADFKDGSERLRWAVSRKETWLDRAKALTDALRPLLPPVLKPAAGGQAKTLPWQSGVRLGEPDTSKPQLR